MATDWLSTYSANLDIRDRRESAHKRYIEAYTLLANRTATSIPSSAPSPHPTSTSPAPPDDGTLTSLRAALTASNSARATLTTNLASTTARMASFESSLTTATARIAQLETRMATQTTRTRDRDHELREKAKLLEAVQDEVVGLTLELNIADEKLRAGESAVARLKTENEELVRRWLERVGVEAEMAGIKGGGREIN